MPRGLMNAVHALSVQVLLIQYITSVTYSTILYMLYTIYVLTYML